MLHPSDRELQPILAVRDGHAAPVTCASCGCRLVVHAARSGSTSARSADEMRAVAA